MTDYDCIVCGAPGVQNRKFNEFNDQTARSHVARQIDRNNVQITVWHMTDTDGFNPYASFILGEKIRGECIIMSQPYLSAEDIISYMQADSKPLAWGEIARNLPATIADSEASQQRAISDAAMRKLQWDEFYAEKRARLSSGWNPNASNNPDSDDEY